LAPIPGQLRNPSLTITARATGLFARSQATSHNARENRRSRHSEARAHAAQIKDSNVSLI
ncbi:MAG TPA: hypothetical protein VII39_04705, partial [Bradyrhizobium sp.]